MPNGVAALAAGHAASVENTCTAWRPPRAEHIPVIIRAILRASVDSASFPGKGGPWEASSTYSHLTGAHLGAVGGLLALDVRNGAAGAAD